MRNHQDRAVAKGSTEKNSRKTSNPQMVTVEPPHLCTKVFYLQLNVVHWNPLCWGIPLVLKWGFYLAQVESYSRLKNAWRAKMGGGNQRSCASVSTEKEVVLNLLCRRALVRRQGELAQMVERSLSMREVAGSMPAFSSGLDCVRHRSSVV